MCHHAPCHKGHTCFLVQCPPQVSTSRVYHPHFSCIWKRHRNQIGRCLEATAAMGVQENNGTRACTCFQHDLTLQFCLSVLQCPDLGTICTTTRHQQDTVRVTIEHRTQKVPRIPTLPPTHLDAFSVGTSRQHLVWGREHMGQVPTREAGMVRELGGGEERIKETWGMRKWGGHTASDGILLHQADTRHSSKGHTTKRPHTSFLLQ
jgi:hypothetical protein